MSLKNLPEIKAFSGSEHLTFDMRPDVAARWQPSASEAGGENVITMYDQIGEGWDGNGVTSKRVSAALRTIGARDVVVNLNSPGGNYFEGIAIYNLLRAHPHKVTVNVVGLAASAASLIAMAGDDVLMGDGSFLMIHNAWSLAVGNRADLQSAIDMLAKVDDAMAQIYVAASGQDKAAVTAMLDAETWLNRDDAVAKGFAHGSCAAVDAAPNGQKAALAKVEASLAQQGYSRKERRDLLANLFGTPRAAEHTVMPCADTSQVAAIQQLIQQLKG